jgi:hypothetical protein
MPISVTFIISPNQLDDEECELLFGIQTMTRSISDTINLLTFSSILVVFVFAIYTQKRKQMNWA